MSKYSDNALENIIQSGIPLNLCGLITGETVSNDERTGEQTERQAYGNIEEEEEGRTTKTTIACE